MTANMIRDVVNWPGYPELQLGTSVDFTDWDSCTTDRRHASWTVRAISRSGRFVCCTREHQAEGPQYTVLDLQRGIRGTDNFHGLGYETDDECSEALECFEAQTVYEALTVAGVVPDAFWSTDTDWVPAEHRSVLIDHDGQLRTRAHISRRNNVELRISLSPTDQTSLTSA